jgi:hypothetical protein
MPRVPKDDLPENVRSMNVKTHPELDKKEQETCFSFCKDSNVVTVYSDIPTFVRWMLSVEDSDINWVNIVDGDVVGCKATVPKGILKMKSKSRQSNRHYGMVGYGPLKS